MTRRDFAVVTRVDCSSVLRTGLCDLWSTASKIFCFAQVALEMATKSYRASFNTMGALRFSSLGICLVAFTGCGNGLATVSGTVTLDGQPVSGAGTYGTVTFSRES